MEKDCLVMRRGTAADAKGFAGLHGRLFAPAWNETDFRTLLSEPSTLAYCVESAPGTIAGFIVGRVAADEAEIITIGVDARHRRRAIGSLLVLELIETARPRGVRGLYLEVAESNAAALRLYAKHGFVEVGKRKDYYTPPGEPPQNALLLWLAL